MQLIGAESPGDDWEEDNILPPSHTHLYDSSDALGWWYMMFLMWGNTFLKYCYQNSAWIQYSVGGGVSDITSLI